MRPQASRHPCAAAGHSAFAMAMCLLGVMALAQLVVAGIALAIRFKETGGTRIVERVVIREVRVGTTDSPPETAGHSPQNHRPEVHGLPAFTTPDPIGTNPMGSHPSQPTGTQLELQPSPLAEPVVIDPDAARLLKEAREARVASDMVKAIVKLEQALHHAPGEPAVVYEMAMIHEQMGIFDKPGDSNDAGDYYEQVYRMGMTRAGALFPLAAAKLRDGFNQPLDMLGKLSLGRVQLFKNTKHQDGEQTILTIPVQKAPVREVDMDSIEVEVRFFNRSTKGDIIELQDPSWVDSSWISLPWDWAGGIEQLRMTYTIPDRDLATEHLFGELSYYGQVVTLSYDHEVLDVQAWPRDLAARITRQPENGYGDLPVPLFQDTLPPEFDVNPILPLTLPE